MLKKQFKSTIVTLSLGGLIAFLMLSIWLEFLDEDKKFDELALGKHTSTLFGKVDGASIHCGDFSDMHKCINGYLKNGINKEIVLWLGNSQLHAINQSKPNDQTASMLLHKKLTDKSKYLLTFSQANANLKEHHTIFRNLYQELPISTLILPIFFDDMRESGVRKTILDMSRYSKIDQGESESKKNTIDSVQNLEDITSTSHGIQKKVEGFLEGIISEEWNLWGKRDILRSEIFHILYLLRNKVFDINASTKRYKIKGRYAINIDEFEKILNFSYQNKINIIVYIPPIRNDVEIPYDIEEYNDFKKEIQILSKKYKASFFILEDIIPGEYWGNKASTSLGEGDKEVDFMHFQAEGHNILANKIYHLLTKD
jgi:hypothetical protein